MEQVRYLRQDIEGTKVRLADKVTCVIQMLSLTFFFFLVLYTEIHPFY